jgi:hypothetical protein
MTTRMALLVAITLSLMLCISINTVNAIVRASDAICPDFAANCYACLSAQVSSCFLLAVHCFLYLLLTLTHCC